MPTAQTNMPTAKRGGRISLSDEQFERLLAQQQAPPKKEKKTPWGTYAGHAALLIGLGGLSYWMLKDPDNAERKLKALGDSISNGTKNFRAGVSSFVYPERSKEEQIGREVLDMQDKIRNFEVPGIKWKPFKNLPQ